MVREVFDKNNKQYGKKQESQRQNRLLKGYSSYIVGFGSSKNNTEGMWFVE